MTHLIYILELIDHATLGYTSIKNTTNLSPDTHTPHKHSRLNCYHKNKWDKLREKRHFTLSVFRFRVPIGLKIVRKTALDNH